MNKGTIVYLGGFELPDKNAAAHRVMSNAKILKHLGYNVVFVDVDKDLEYKKSVYQVKNLEDFTVWSQPYPKTHYQWLHYLRDISIVKKIEKNYPNIKMVICYNYPSIALRKIQKYFSNKNVKVVSDCTEWYDTSGMNLLSKMIKGLDSFYRMRILQKKVDGIIVISNLLDNYYMGHTKTLLLPPLVDVRESKWKINYALNGEEINFVYAGSPSRNKDKLNEIIKILAKFIDKNFKFKIVGITKEEYLLKNQNHELLLKNMKEKIVFIGRVSHQESIRIVKESDFSVFYRESNRMTNAGFPTKFVESISCGIPVISTDTSDLKEYIIDGENGYLTKNNNIKELQNIFDVIFRLKREHVNKMKELTQKSNFFSHDNYISEMDQFLDEIQNNIE
ncbi:MAG: hypothetical protein C0425_10915 [Chlorobiaceae bacterium]|nr:hypothetical protein [Chlorobiaceae bacterium]